MHFAVSNLRRKRWAFLAFAWLLYIMQVQLYFQGLFMTKRELPNVSPVTTRAASKHRKVVMMLVDALREDFVEWPDERARISTKRYLDPKQSTYKGAKLDLFEDLLIEEPNNSIMLPLESELPTVTTVKIKTIMTGGMSSFFETREDFAHEPITEDSVLRQAKAANKSVLFTGDHIWLDMFGNYFDEEHHYPSYNVRDLDTNDKSVAKDLKEMLNRDFDLLVCHLIGIDHAGHTFHANHTEIERKIKETNDVLKEVIDQLDEETVLLLYGDHGMTADGNHGGDSEFEVRTVFFAYTKVGFPLLSDQKAMKKFAELKAFDDMKLQDVAATAADLLGISTPFSNLGVLNPLLHFDAKLEMPARMFENLAQIERFV